MGGYAPPMDETLGFPSGLAGALRNCGLWSRLFQAGQDEKFGSQLSGDPGAGWDQDSGISSSRLIHRMNADQPWSDWPT